ncbi:MAG: glycosyltransferase, partial [Candidatus Krumholzibacteria bacterium]|nr:glycosyltransferase [Candidatus Krumholzibacteria bacterium]
MVFSRKTTKVFLLATTLSTGGAEKVVRALTLGLPRYGFDTNVLCLHGMGQVGLELSDLGASVRYKLSRGRFDPTVLVRLAGIFRRDREAILFTLDHHDAIFWGALASLFAGIRYRVLSVHSTGMWAKRSSFNFMDRLVMPFYNRVVALADLHRQYLERREGVDSERIALIANGVDTGRFKPIGSDDDRERVRDSYSIPAGNFVVTIIAALRPEKNHEMFLRSAAEISSRIENFTFLVVGEGKEARKLQDLAVELSLGDTVRFMGL